MITIKNIDGKMKGGKLQAKFTHCYFNCDPFKQKEIAHLNALISGSRLINYLTFDGYASITFDEDDAPHRYPLISTLDDNGEKLDWSRKTTNCLVFNFIKTGKNDMYDKIFLYHTCSHNGNGVWYGWIAWDSKSHKMSHRFFVNHDPQDLMQALNRMIYHIPIVTRNERLLRESRMNSHKYINT